jgi:hypothetical protein
MLHNNIEALNYLVSQRAIGSQGHESC